MVGTILPVFPLIRFSVLSLLLFPSVFSHDCRDDRFPIPVQQRRDAAGIAEFPYEIVDAGLGIHQDLPLTFLPDGASVLEYHIASVVFFCHGRFLLSV